MRTVIGGWNDRPIFLVCQFSGLRHRFFAQMNCKKGVSRLTEDISFPMLCVRVFSDSDGER
jgi:hypothetical protein